MIKGVQREFCCNCFFNVSISKFPKVPVWMLKTWHLKHYLEHVLFLEANPQTCIPALNTSRFSEELVCVSKSVGKPYICTYVYYDVNTSHLRSTLCVCMCACMCVVLINLLNLPLSSL